jgi:holo-ACP synthase
MSYIKDIEKKPIERILASREHRARMQSSLIKKHNCNLICITLNIPGPIKDSTLYRKIHDEGVKVLLENLSCKGIETICVYSFKWDTGPEAYLCVQTETKGLKALTVEIEENHELGRFWDIDVLNQSGQTIKRAAIGLDSRKCMLCGGDVQVCRWNNAHSIEDLTDHIKRKGHWYFNKNIKG